MFKCKDCGRFFEQPIVCEMEKDTGYVEQTCPHCGGDYFEEAHACPLCGEPTTEDFCQDCYDIVKEGLEALKEKLGATQDNLEQIISNHFGW